MTCNHGWFSSDCISCEIEAQHARDKPKPMPEFGAVLVPVAKLTAMEAVIEAARDQDDHTTRMLIALRALDALENP
jgi:hypothetical protein